MNDDDPVEEYFDEKEKQATMKSQKDFQLWEEWNSAGRSPERLEPLLKRFEPTFTKKVNDWKAPTVSESALRSNMARQAIKAFESFDPNRGTQLHTHLQNQLKKSLRFMKKHQNLAYIPEEKSGLIGPIQRAQDQLVTQFGRQPTPLEISHHLMVAGGLTDAQKRKMTGRMVQQVQASQRKDIPSSMYESDPTPRSAVTEREALHFLRGSLSDPEKQVYDLIKKNPEVTGEAIAGQLNMSSSQVSRIRKSIAKKFKSGA